MRCVLLIAFALAVRYALDYALEQLEIRTRPTWPPAEQM